MYVWSQMEKCRLMSVLEKYCVLIQQFAVSTLDQFVWSFEISVVCTYVLICPKCYKSYLIRST